MGGLSTTLRSKWHTIFVTPEFRLVWYYHTGEGFRNLAKCHSKFLTVNH